MKQWLAIEAVQKAAQACSEVRAIFLKGSLAYGNADEYSDVDFYCLVGAQQVQAFLEKRMNLLEHYRPIIYHSESDFVGPQIVTVFDDGLHFDLYTVTSESFPTIGAFKVLYDPDNLLEEFQGRVKDHSVSSSSVMESFSEFSFALLEFHTAWQRGDMTWATRLASHLSGYVGMVLRFRYDRRNAMLGSKRLENVLPMSVRSELRAALSLCCGRQLPAGVQRLCSLMQDTATELHQQDGVIFRWDLFNFMNAKLAELCD